MIQKPNFYNKNQNYYSKNPKKNQKPQNYRYIPKKSGLSITFVVVKKQDKWLVFDDKFAFCWWATDSQEEAKQKIFDWENIMYSLNQEL